MGSDLSHDALFQAVSDILAVTVLLDRRERDRELIEYVHAVQLHNQDIRPETILPRRKILEQFHARKDALITRLDGDGEDEFKRDLLSKVTDKDLQRKILCSVFTISICDYELHDEESDFIKKALDIWKADMPSAAEVESVA